MRLSIRLFLIILFAALRPTTAQANDAVSRVVILANADDRASVALAQTYAGARHIPAANIISLSLPSSETLSWSEFIRALWTPLQEHLVAQGWIDAVGTSLVDGLGRRKWAVLSHRISYLVVCKGVPLRIENDPALFTENPPMTRNPQFRHNTGAVDSELSLLTFPEYPINGFVPNPLFNSRGPTILDSALVVKVSRLDGPTFDDARGLIESALTAEQEGLIGRFWIDAGGPHASGDRWLEEAGAKLAELGYPGEKDTARDTLGGWVRADGIAWYFGWYNQDIDGPFRLPGFRFAPGAIALHIHSFTATSLRSSSQGWSGPLVARGVAGTFGNVAEPYLEFSHQPHKVVEALAQGMTFGDAAYFALTALSWQAIAIGDPLYRPFTLSPDDQWNRRQALSPTRVAHLVLRRLNLARASATPPSPADVAAQLAALPTSPAGLVGLADELERTGNKPAARKTLERAQALSPSAAADWGLFALIAERLERDHGASASAVEIWRRVLSSAQAPVAVQVRWLNEALHAAKSAGRQSDYDHWKRDLADLESPHTGTK